MVFACIDLGNLSNIPVCNNSFLLVPLADVENKHDFHSNENERELLHMPCKSIIPQNIHKE